MDFPGGPPRPSLFSLSSFSPFSLSVSRVPFSSGAPGHCPPMPPTRYATASVTHTAIIYRTSHFVDQLSSDSPFKLCGFFFTIKSLSVTQRSVKDALKKVKKTKNKTKQKQKTKTKEKQKQKQKTKQKQKKPSPFPTKL